MKAIQVSTIMLVFYLQRPGFRDGFPRISRIYAEREYLLLNIIFQPV
jgi:hypothetical protein